MKTGGFHGGCNWVQIFGLESLSLRRNYGGLGGIVRESGDSLRKDQTLRDEKEQEMVVAGRRWNQND